MSRLSEGSLVVTHNKSYSLTAEIEVPKSGANGVIVALGGGVGGWSLYAHEGKLKHCYNFFGIEYYYAEGKKPIPAGKHQVRMEFEYDGGGLAKGGKVSLYVDGKKDGEGRVDQTVPMLFSADETCDVGKETGSTVSPDYGIGRQRVQRQGQLGPDRLGERRSGPPDLARGAFPRRDGAAVTRAGRPGGAPDAPSATNFRVRRAGAVIAATSLRRTGRWPVTGRLLSLHASLRTGANGCHATSLPVYRSPQWRFRSAWPMRR